MGVRAAREAKIDAFRGAALYSLTREELEAEVARLRGALAMAGVDAQRVSVRQDERDAEHQAELAFSRAETAYARQESQDAHTVAGEQQRRLDVATSDLAAAQGQVRDLETDRLALARSEARQRAIFESAIDFAMVVTDPAGIVTDWNPGAERVTGWTAEEMRGQDAERFFTPEDRVAGRIAFEMERALQDGRASDERWHLCKDGQRFWASGEMMPLRGEAGVHIGFVKILRDRTAEHLAGIALQEAQERYRLAARATNDAVWDWDLAKNNVLWNEALEEAYGHPLAVVEPTGEWWIAHIHPDDRARVEASIHAVIDGTGSAWTDGYRFQRADGSYAEVLDRGHVIRNAEGQAVRMIGAMLDLTRLRTVETALRASEQQLVIERGVLRAVFQQAPVGISIAYADGRGEINAVMERMIGHPVGEASDARYASYGAVHPDGRPYAVEEYPTIRALRRGETLLNAPMTYRNASSGEVRRWEVSSSPVRDADGTILAAVSVILDVEDRQRAEEHQEVLNRELSHRLKNTLAMVQAIARQTLNTAPNKESASETLGARLIALGRAHDILLTGLGESADMQAVIAGALNLHDDGRPGRFVLEGPILRVGEKAALSLSLMIHELATNATKYGALSTPKGWVNVTWAVTGTPGEETVELAWRERGGPPVQAPTRKGFGSRLIERGLAGTVGGVVVLQYPAEGVSCTLTAPLSGMQSQT